MVAQGLQRKFLHTLTHHHMSNKFDTVSQGTKTIQEVLNDLKKYAVRMIHLPDVYMFCKWFVSALCDSLCNEELKKGYNAEFRTINQLYETAHMIEEASHYNHGMQHTENMHTAASNTKPAAHKALLSTTQLSTIVGRENVVHCTQPTCMYNAPKPEQKTVQVKDSSTKPIYQLPKREGNSMNITCYECGQAGHIQTNYGTQVTIKIGHKVVKEYFNIANVEHYDAILGTPFLRKMQIVLDFRSPGMAWIGNKVIPTGKVSFDESRILIIILPQRAILYRAAVLPWAGNEARRVDYRRAHPKVPLAPARGSILILG